jgi:hypothetical protein
VGGGGADPQHLRGLDLGDRQSGLPLDLRPAFTQDEDPVEDVERDVLVAGEPLEGREALLLDEPAVRESGGVETERLAKPEALLEERSDVVARWVLTTHNIQVYQPWGIPSPSGAKKEALDRAGALGRAIRGRRRAARSRALPGRPTGPHERGGRTAACSPGAGFLRFDYPRP